MEPTASVRKAYRQAVKAMRRAHAPYSKFHVGAALISKRGTIFTGCNVENASYGATICAERVAVSKAVSEGHKQFRDVIVITSLNHPAPPCGMCLQVLAEFCADDAIIWMGNPRKLFEGVSFKALYPNAFRPQQLQGGK